MTATATKSKVGRHRTPKDVADQQLLARISALAFQILQCLRQPDHTLYESERTLRKWLSDSVSFTTADVAPALGLLESTGYIGRGPEKSRNSPRARLYAELRPACSGEKQYRDGVLKQIISEVDERITEIAEAAKALDLGTVEDQAAWNNYHSAFCRYRELQADVVRQLREELDPRTRRAREEDVVDIDQLFDPVCPRCKEPISVDHKLGNASGE